MTRPVRPTYSLLAPAVVAFVLAGAACGNRIVPLGPSGNPRTVAVTVETFAGALPVNGSRFYSFTVPQDGLVALTLLSLTENGEPSSATVNIGVGVPQGTGCSLLNSRTTGPGATPQFSDFFQAAVYCARVADVGGLTSDVTFALNIVYPKRLQ
jgi:hypothetical protein